MFRLLADFEIPLKFHLSQSNAKNLWKQNSRGVPLYLNQFFERKKALDLWQSRRQKSEKNTSFFIMASHRQHYKIDVSTACGL